MPAPKKRITRKPAPKKRTTRKSDPTRFDVIHLLSDSTGNLGQHMLTAFLTQFPADAFDVRRHNFLSTPALVAQAMTGVDERPGIVFHALVSPESKAAVNAACTKAGLPACDLTGNFVEFITRHSGVAPKADVRMLHDISEAYHKRIKALEFTLEHDDGLGLETLDEADVVLVGVSRTSKTPTSIFLAQQGFKTANVSLARSVAPPAQLLALKKRSVVGLLIDPMRLSEIRTSRQRSWDMSDTRYNTLDEVQEEVEWSRKLFASRGWPTIDVTSRAVEETAGKIVELLRIRNEGIGIK
ncbi:MAG: pyruvate, water dikinase regulatory protein [Phycisphaerae bacterium]